MTLFQPGDPKPRVTSQFPQKVSIQITLHQKLQKESKREKLILLFKRVSFLKRQAHFLFSLLPYSRASNLGKIYANFSGEIVTSSSVLDHREKIHFLAFTNTTDISDKNAIVTMYLLCLRLGFVDLIT